MSSVLSTNNFSVTFLTAQTATPVDLSAISVCGTPCSGECQTCVQSNADLEAFFAPAEPAVAVVIAQEPIEVLVMAPAGDDESQDNALEVARAMDAIEEAQRSGEAYDDDDGYRGCQCLDCLNADDPNYVPYYADRDDYDDGYGLDWNESGYFD